MSPSHQWYGVIPGWVFYHALIVIALALLVHRVTYLLRIMLKGKAAARNALWNPECHPLTSGTASSPAGCSSTR